MFKDKKWRIWRYSQNENGYNPPGNLSDIYVSTYTYLDYIRTYHMMIKKHSKTDVTGRFVKKYSPTEWGQVNVWTMYNTSYDEKRIPVSTKLIG